MTTSNTQMSRRTLLLGSAALGGLAAFGSSPSRAQTGPVRFGIFGNAQKLEIRGKSIARFNERHPNIPVTFEGIPSASWPDKIAAMIAGGNAPDVITLGSEDLPQYASRGALTPLDKFIPALFRADLFDKTVLDLGRIDDKIYGVPIAVSIQGLAYNQSALERIGMGELPAAWNYDEFAKFCADIHRADPNLYGSHDGAARLDAFQMYLISQGRSLYSNRKLSVTADEVAAWLDYWDKMRKSGGAVPADLQAQFTGTEWPNSPLVKGKAVFASIASQDLSGGYQALTKDTLSITTPPSAAPGGSPGYFPQPTSSLCLYSKSRNQEAAVKVIDWFVSDPESAKILGLISGPPASKPALQAVLELTDLAPVDQRVLKYSQAALAKAEPAPPPQVAGRAMEDLMRRVNEDVGFSKSSVKDAAQAFINQGNALLRRA
ncbi:ABC transporter substrate-binding protein [Microvirga yunnanensis]|uniref:ABC transporter substrate-binding protein n=1 Tax=Microvirga yunnanensis TaxID=2953740 RepID=UPI0021C71711|nr:extracellular solute-binding protein [Microvirga sp. HBU65207]